MNEPQNKVPTQADLEAGLEAGAETVASKLKGGKKRIIASEDPNEFEFSGELDLNSFGIDTEKLDPNFHYRIGFDGQQRMAQLRSKGYTPVKRSDSEVTLLMDLTQGHAEDIFRIGDGILMKCPRELYERRRKRVAQQNVKRLSVPELNFRKKAERAPEPIEVVQDKK